jgi:ABC-type Na+ transport system ATPase subunit NatA
MILFSSHRFDVVEQICCRAVILSGGRIVAEEQMHGAGGTRDSSTLEDVFARVTCQQDYASLAAEILHVVRS